MSRLLTILLASLLLMMPADAASQQKRKTSSRPKTESPAKAGSGKKNAAKKPAANSSGKKKASAAKKPAKGKAASSNRSEKEVRRDKSRAETEIKETRRQLQLNAEETSRKLSQLNLVEGEIEQCNTRIGEISTRLDSINSQISQLNDSIEALDNHLRQITATYVKAVKRSQGRRQQMSALAFIFSSDSFAQAYRRLRYLRRFAKWREKRASEITAAREVLDGKRRRMASLADAAAKSKNELSREHTSLVKKQTETANLVGELRHQGSVLKEIMAQQRAKASALDRELDNVIAREAAKREEARRAAEAEKARKAAEAEAARKAAAEEAARKAAQEEAEAKRAEEARKAAEVKKRKEEKRAKTKPVKHSGKAGDSQPATDGGQAAPTLHTPDHSSESGTASKSVESGADFASLKGSLPFPITGRYTIVKRFGRQQHPSLPHVVTDNAGIDIETAKGAAVRSVCDGEVSAVFRPEGYNTVVVIRHGSHMTVYANLASVSVSSGQKVKAGQNIGTVFSDPNDNGRSILHFEVRDGRQKENPELWLRK